MGSSRMHSIKALSKIAGVNADTIRSWERRYGVVDPRRDENGRRAYSRQDVERLTLVAKLVRGGHTISRIADLDFNTLVELSKQLDEAKPSDDLSSPSLAALVEAIDSADVDRFRIAIGNVFASLPPHTATECVVAPALRMIGSRWADGRIDAGLEHAFSSVVRQQILAALATLRWAASGPGLLFTTLSGERHEIGALMACYVSAAKGCECTYLGPDLPPDDIIKSVQRFDARVVAISSIHHPDVQDAARQVRRLAEGLPDGVEIWLGVGGHSPVDTSELPDRVAVISGFEDLERRLDGLRG